MILSQDHNWIQQVCWSTILPTEYYPMDKGTVKTDVAQVSKLPTAVQVDPNDTGNDGSQAGNLPYLKRNKVN